MKDEETRIDQMVRAAWMYYISGKNQSEIASLLGTSRPVVQRLLASAKDEGIISVNVNHPLASCLDLALALKEKFRFGECEIVPASVLDSSEEVLESVTFGGYQLMQRLLSPQPGKIIGIGSGMTLKRTINRIEFSHESCECVALISGMAKDGHCNYYDDVPLLLAQKIQAKYYQWPAPRHALSLEDHQIWQRHPIYRNVLGKAHKADVIFIGVGGMGKTGPMLHDGFITYQESQQLESSGAVGEILGRFIDSQGAVLNCHSNTLITSFDIRETDCPRIAIACGEEKRAAILAAIHGQWINGLVTDELTAKWLLQQTR